MSTLHLSPLRQALIGKLSGQDYLTLIDGAEITIWSEGSGILTGQAVRRDGTPRGNPFVAADGGDLDCYLPAGRYRVRARKDGFERDLRDVQLGTFAQHDFGTLLAHQGTTGAWRADVSYGAGVLVSHTVLGSLPFGFVSRHADNLGNPPIIGGDLALAGGAPFGDMTSGGGLGAALDSVTSKAAAACAVSASTASGSPRYIGLDFAEPRPIAYAVVYGANDQGFVASANPTTTIGLYGKNDSAPANATDGTLLGQIVFTDTANESAGRTVNGSGDWRFVWARISQAGGVDRVMQIAQLQFRGPFNLYGQPDEHWTVIGLNPPGQFYTTKAFFPGDALPAGGETLDREPFETTVEYPSDLQGWSLTSRTLAAEDAVFQVKKMADIDDEIGEVVGTLTIPEGEKVAIKSSDGFTCEPGTFRHVCAPDPPVEGLSDLTLLTVGLVRGE